MAQLSLFAAKRQAKTAKRRARTAEQLAKTAARKAAALQKKAAKAAARHEAVKVRAYSRRWPRKKGGQ